MTVSSILQRIQKRAQITPGAESQTSKSPSPASSSSTLASSARSRPAESGRVVDPVVARLKAARKAEMEKKQQELREKKGLAPKKTPSKPAAKPKTTQGQAVPRRSSPAKPGARNSAKSALPPPKPLEKKPKMSFNDLMKKASGIDQSKLSITIKNKSKSPDTTRQARTEQRPRSSEARDRMPPPSKAGPNARPAQRPAVTHKAKQPKDVAVRAPLPTRKPSSHLEQKLSQKHQSKPQYEEEDDSDMDSFIASDEEEAGASQLDYDRDEIWSIFNRGKKRTYDYDDYDSDDMEATGAEIFEEEDRSKRNAMDEDRREMAEEARLAALKRARKMKRSQ